MNVTGANSALLIDTQALVWVATGSSRLSAVAAAAMTDGTRTLLISAVTAFEFVDLNRRGRFAADLPFAALLDRLDAEVVDYPGEIWPIIDSLPRLHGDPVDRMLIAHAVHLDAILVTADATMRRYPVRSLW